MTPLRSTRRDVVAVVGLVWLLVCGGLGWATRSAIQLDHVEDRDNQRRTDEARMERALARVEAELAPVLYPERARPYSHFRSYFITTEARYRRDGGDASRDIVVASPLKDFRGPDWMLLHFQVSESEGWSSPELDAAAQFATPAGAIPAADRPREATPENWLAALKERYTADSLQQVLEWTLMRTGATGQHGTESESAAPAAADGAPNAENTPEGAAERTTQTESARRAARLLQLQRETYPEFSCEPELVAMENLEARPRGLLNRTGTEACVNVYAPLMTPVWLDLTLDGRPQLALVRSTSVETSGHCTLQGVLLDWERLKADLERQIRDIFPDARLVPVLPNDAGDAQSFRGRLHTIPARVDIGASQRVAAEKLSPGLMGGLVVSWGATLLALAAVTYGVLKYLGISERRMRFVAAVTHELRTPLTSFQLYADLLSEMDNEDGQKRRRYADTLRGEAARLARLVENVLSYSRLQEGLPGVSPATVEPSRILEDARAATAELCREAGKTLALENQCPEGFALDTDPEFVLRILTNLIENSCKYSAGAADARIFLTSAPGPGGGVAFEVEDGGPGIAPHERREIFEPFRRGRQDSERKAGGVGLGLSLSRYWAHCLGGLLTLRRGRRNGAHYSCFALTLPRCAPRTAADSRA